MPVPCLKHILSSLSAFFGLLQLHFKICCVCSFVSVGGC